MRFVALAQAADKAAAQHEVAEAAAEAAAEAQRHLRKQQSILSHATFEQRRAAEESPSSRWSSPARCSSFAWR